MFKGFQKPKRLVANTETLTERFGQFTAQPFQRGFGTTIGNSLRRVLLSSIEGAAITAIRIEGVDHEFSPIPGVVEDATDIILNLKQVPFKVMGEGIKTVRVVADKAGEVFSGAIQTDADVEVLDRTLHIATVSEGGKLDIEMRLKSGRGYVSADKNFDEDLAIGYIPIDSVHSPVRKVNFTVEAARLGQMTDYDKLTIEVWTNGAISPQDAIGHAAKLLKDHMTIFINFEEVMETTEEPAERNLDRVSDQLNRSVEELELSVRSYNCLKNAGIQTIGELVQKSESEMLRTKNFGRKSLNEIKEILQTMGLALGMKPDAHGRLIAPPPPPPGSIPRIFRTTISSPDRFIRLKEIDHETSIWQCKTEARRRVAQQSVQESDHERDRGRARHHDRPQGEGDAAARREDDHSRQARHAPHAPSGRVISDHAQVGAEAVRHPRQPLRPAHRRLHPHHAPRTSQG